MHVDDPKYLTELANAVEAKLSNPNVERTAMQRVHAMAGLTKARVLASGKQTGGDREKILQDMADNFIEAGNVDMPSNP